jgi:type IV pilus assembly protein PilB
MPIRPAAAAPDDIAALIARLGQLGDAVGEVQELEPEPLVGVLEGADLDAPIVKLVHSIIAQAVEQGASDIHCKPGTGEMRVLFRVDGVLTPAARIAGSMASGVASRIKIMASLDIAERRVAQDGRLAVTVDGRRIDVRVVTLPLVKGEGVVMRILDTGAVVRDLDSLGMHPHDRERFETAVGKPYGAVLITGPTGHRQAARAGVATRARASFRPIRAPIGAALNNRRSRGLGLRYKQRFIRVAPTAPGEA